MKRKIPVVKRWRLTLPAMMLLAQLSSAADGNGLPKGIDKKSPSSPAYCITETITIRLSDTDSIPLIKDTLFFPNNYKSGLSGRNGIAALLPEIIVTPVNSQKRNADTVSYQVADLHPTSGTMLAGLLKRIPGVELSKDGTILIQGKPVGALLIEGDDLISRNDHMIAANLPADMIEKIQIVADYYPDKLLKGLLPGDQKAVNIVLKEKYRKRVAGNLALGAGSDNRYHHRLSMASFSRKITILGFQRMSNAGDPSADHLSADGYTQPSFSEEFQLTPAFTHTTGAEHLGRLREKGLLFNKATHHSLSFSSKLFAGIQLKGSAWYTGSAARLEGETISYLSAGEAATFRETIRLSQKDFSSGGQLKIEIPLGKTARLEYTSLLLKRNEYTDAYTNSHVLTNSGAHANGGAPANSGNPINEHLLTNSDARTSKHGPVNSGASSDIPHKQALRLTWRINKRSALQGGAVYTGESLYEQLGFHPGEGSSRNVLLQPGLLTSSANFADAGYSVKQKLQPTHFQRQLNSPLNQLVRYIKSESSAWLYYTYLFGHWQMVVNLNGANEIKWLRSAVLNKKGHPFSAAPGNNESEVFKSRTAGLSLTRTLGRSWRLSTRITGYYRAASSPSPIPAHTPGINKFTGIIPSVNIRWRHRRHQFSLDYTSERQWAGLPELYAHDIFKDSYTTEKSLLSGFEYPVTQGTVGYTYTGLSEKLLAWLRVNVINSKGSPQPQPAGNDLAAVYIMPAAQHNRAALAAGLDKYLASLYTGIRFKGSIMLSRTRFVSMPGMHTGNNTSTPAGGQLNANPMPVKHRGTPTLFSTRYFHLSFRSAFKGFFNYNAGTELTRILWLPGNRAAGESLSFQSPAKYRQTELMNFLDIDLTVSRNLKIRVSAEQWLFRSAEQTAVPCYFANFQITYTGAGDKWALSLTGKNLTALTGKSLTKTRLLAATGFQTYRISVQNFFPERGYLMFWVNFRF